MSRPTPKRSVEDTLTTISALRRFCLHETGTLLEMAARIPPDFPERDRWLQSFVVAAREQSKSTARG